MRRFTPSGSFSSRLYSLFRKVDSVSERFQSWCARLHGRSRALSFLVGAGLLVSGVAVTLGLVVALAVVAVVLVVVLIGFLAVVAVFGLGCAVLVGLILSLSYLVLPFMCLMSGKEAGGGMMYNGGRVDGLENDGKV